VILARFPIARLPLARLVRSPRAIAPALFWIAVALAAAFALRDAHGADHALRGAYAVIALPLLAYGVVGAALGDLRLSEACRPLVAFGASPIRVARVTIATAALACAVACGSLAALVALIAHGSGDPPRIVDAIESAYVGALGGAAYACLFAFGASFGSRGRAFVLAVDWIVGSTTGPIALVVPRAHVRNLLGGIAPADVSPRVSSLVLVVLAIVFASLAVRRSRT
jgi:hypothetical protein